MFTSYITCVETKNFMNEGNITYHMLTCGGNFTFMYEVVLHSMCYHAHGDVYSIQHYVMKFVRLVVFSEYSHFLHQ